MKVWVLKTYLITLGLLITFYLIPSYFMIDETWPDELMIMRSPENYQLALNYIWILITTYTFTVFIGLFLLKSPPIDTAVNYNSQSFSKIKFEILMTIISYCLIFYSIDLKDIINAETRFFSKYGKLINISSVMLLYIFCVNLFTENKKSVNYYLLVISFIGFMIYPIAHSSRATAVPMVITAIYYFYIKNNYLKSLIFVYLSSVFLGSALTTRNELGFIYYIINLFYIFFNPSLIYEKIMYIIPGLGTSSLALQMFSEGWSFDGGLKNFMMYISPIPSIFLPEKFWELGYSVYLNVTYMGLNSDYMSEWIWWFGYWGCIIGGILTGLITIFPLIIGFKLKLGKFSLLLISLACLYFIMAGTSMSLRSSSRIFFYVITVIIFKNILDRLKKVNVKNC